MADARGIDQSPDVKTAVAKIRKQLEVNLGYFTGSDRDTLDILQDHIEDQLKEIEYHTHKSE